MTDLSQVLGTVASMAQALPEPAGRLVAALALLGQRAIAINPENPAQVVEEESLATSEARVNAKFGAAGS